tara:strand:- start:1002 stop:2318 length:1317 start_codon:yes stop_codon:yes gene_type:complete
VQEKKSIVWFTNNLRVFDNASLYRASKDSDKVIGYYNFQSKNFENDKWGFKRTEGFRLKFLLESLENLKINLLDLNISLIIDFSPNMEGLVKWINQLKISSIYYQKEWTDYEILNEKELKNKLPKGFKFNNEFDQFLFHPIDVKKSIESIDDIFSVFRKKIEKNIKVRECTPTPKKLDNSNLLKIKFDIPKMSSLGYDNIIVHPNSAFPFLGGSNEGIKRIDYYFWKSKKLSFYKKTRNGLLKTDYSSKLSSWLANGALSAKQIYWEVKNYEKKVLKNSSTYWLIFELLWRDYFKFISMKYGNKIFHLNGISSAKRDWNRDTKKINDWINGKTKEPFIDSNMIELKKTGWMSNRGRQNVASYLTKDLQIDWRIGAAYFESMLIDYDVHSNYGNWMYNAGVGNDPLPDRKFNPKIQSERYDPNKIFQKLWLNTQYEIDL